MVRVPTEPEPGGHQVLTRSRNRLNAPSGGKRSPDPVTVHEVSGGDGGIDGFDVSAAGRHVRVHGTERGTGCGSSLYEFGVYS